MSSHMVPDGNRGGSGRSRTVSESAYGETIAAIRQACTDLEDAYETLAETALPALQGLQAGIGNIVQYHYRKTVRPDDGAPEWTEDVYVDEPIQFSNNRYLSYERMEDVPHPRREDVRQAAREVYGELAEDDEIFAEDIADLVETPRKLGDFITDWLLIAGQFAPDVQPVIPSNLAFIETGGGVEGWRSSSAFNSYEATASSQDTAADTAEQVMTDLMDQCAEFLHDIGTTLAAYASWVIARQEFQDSLIGGAAPPMSIREGFQMVENWRSAGTETRNEKIEGATIEGDRLNGSIQALLDIDALNRDIDAMGEQTGDNGWPGPASMNVLPSGEEPASQTTLSYNAQYFADHSAFWQDVSTELGALATEADGVADLPVMFARLPNFTASRANALNRLSGRLATDVLRQGEEHTQEISDNLDATIRNYLAVEAENEAIAGQIIAEYLAD